MRLRRSLGTLVLACLACGVARADKLDAQQFHPAATSSDFFGLDEATVLPHLHGAVGLTLSDGHDALELRDDGKVVPGGHIIEHQVWLEAMGSVGLFERFEVGLALPIALYQGGNGAAPGFDFAGALRNQRGGALGDLRIDPKMLFLDRAHAQHRLTLSFVAGLTLPTSTTDLAGEHNVTFRPRLVFEWAWRRVHAVATFGAIFRARAELVGLDVGDQLTYGVGAIVAAWRGIELQAELRGAVTVVSPPGYHVSRLDAPTELDAGIAYRTRFGFRGWLAAGGTLGDGYGAPAFRVLLGARYIIPEGKHEVPWNEQDADHDGIPNGVDRCISEPGPAANGGCADTDFDGDGVIDRLDKCPDRPGVAANDGCPDDDADGDGVPDRFDRCPKYPGTKKFEGCPVRDTDGDGVPDSEDHCVDAAGPATNEGCPETDSDLDGLIDRLDKCPDQAEIYNNVEDDDGCPDEGKELAALVPGQVALFEPIVFDKEGTVEKLSARSVPVLSALGALLRAHVELTHVRIDGHTDDRGDPVDNLDLSLARARLVRTWLVEEGHIEPQRLTEQGFGSNRPLVENTTPASRARNRRIEITVLTGTP